MNTIMYEVAVSLFVSRNINWLGMYYLHMRIWDKRLKMRNRKLFCILKRRSIIGRRVD